MRGRMRIAIIPILIFGALLVVLNAAPPAMPLSGHIYFRETTGHHYVWIENRLPWNDANKFAHSYSVKVNGVTLNDWHLATITDADENAYVFNAVLNGPSPSSPASQGFESFLGAIVTDGGLQNFKWVTGERFSYTNWASGQPDFPRENVIEMGGMYGSQWNNEDGPGSPFEGSQGSHPFILEHEPGCGEPRN